MSRVKFVAEGQPSPIATICSFSQLPDGWNYGEGRGATEDAVTAAIELNSLLVRYAHEIEVFPGVDGGILLCGYYEDQVLEIRCDPSGRMDMWLEVADEPVYEQDAVSLDTISAFLGDLGWQAKNSFGYLIQSITAEKEGDLPARYFKDRREMEVSLHLIPDVLSSIAEVSVSMSHDTIKDQPGSLSFCGDSTQVYYLTIADWLVSPRLTETRATGTYTVSRMASAAT